MAEQSRKRKQEEARDHGRPVEHLHVWQFQPVRDLFLIAVVIGLIWAGYKLRAVTVPLLVALLLAYLFAPLVARLTRRGRLSRRVVVGGLLATVGLVVVAGLALVIPIVVEQTRGLVSAYEQGQFRSTALQLSGRVPERWRGPVLELIEYLPIGAEAESEGSEGEEGSGTRVEVLPGAEPPADPEGADERLRAIIREEIARVRGAATGETEEGPSWLSLARGGARAVATVLGSMIQLGFLAFLIPFYFFFFSVSYPSVASFGRSLIPEAKRGRALRLLSQMDAVVAGFVRGRIVISLMMGALLAAGWWIVGVPYPIVLGLVVGLFCAVPYLGGVGIPVAVVLLAVQQLGQADGPTMAWWEILLWPTAVFVAVQGIEGYVLTPLIAGKTTRLDPVTIVVAVLAGGSIMGVYGMLLAIPVAACVKILLVETVLPRVRAWTSGVAADPLPIKRDDEGRAEPPADPG